MQLRRIARSESPPSPEPQRHNGRPQTGPKERSHELDGLRAVAIVLVVASHTLNGSVDRGLGQHGLRVLADGIVALTTSGVDLFFVLSAYLLLTPYAREGRRLKPANYFKRRVQRLWPAYLAALMFAGLVVVVARSRLTWYSASQIPRPSVGGWAAQLGVVNFGWTTYNGAWWSLTLEFLFYLCLPAVLAVLLIARSPRGGKALVAMVAAVSAGSFFVASRPGVVQMDRVGAEAFAYVPCFLMGLILARFSFSTRVAALLTASGGTLAVLGIVDRGLNPHVGFALLYTGIIGLATGPCRQPREFLTNLKAVWLGERSYSFFLVHLSVFLLTDYAISLLVPARNLLFDATSRLIGLPLALLAAMTLFWYVERRSARGLVTGDMFWPPMQERLAISAGNGRVERLPTPPAGQPRSRPPDRRGPSVPPVVQVVNGDVGPADELLGTAPLKQGD